MGDVDSRAPGLRSAPAAAAVLLLAAPSLQAQTVTGELTDRQAAAPIEGAFVRLLGLPRAPGDTAADRAVATEVDAVFTGADGRFRLHAEAAGRYLLRVERIGYRTVRTEPFRLVGSRTLEKDLFVEPRGIRLEGISVTGEERCELHPASALEAGRVWGEVRKALAGAVHTRRQDRLRYTVHSFRYRLDERLNREDVLLEATRTDLGVVPFQSLPADRLSARGYVQRAGGALDRFYYAPGAGVLLSDSFRSDHCFWVTRDLGEHPGWVGLAFRPARDRGVPEIEGVIWVDERSAELRRLEFRYTDYDLDGVASRPGGTVQFERVEEGPWIVSSWHILMPLVESRVLRAGDYIREPEDVLTGYKKVGGRVLEARTASGKIVYRREQASG